MCLRKLEAEKYLRASGIDYTIVRPGHPGHPGHLCRLEFEFDDYAFEDVHLYKAQGCLIIQNYSNVEYHIFENIWLMSHLLVQFICHL